METCDLHLHSSCSDGTDSPAELAALAAEAGVRAAALTDHNTVGGLGEFSAACAALGLACVPGAEFTTEYGGVELHVLGLFLPESSWSAVTARLAGRTRQKTASSIDCVNRLEAAGLPISWQQVERRFPQATINRPLIGRYLMEQGAVSSVRDAFDRYLDPEKGFYVPAERLPFLRTIGEISRWSGVSVLAHPLLNVSRAELPALLETAKGAGLDGVETRYSQYSPDDGAFMSALAEKEELLQSGGSDYHGGNKPGLRVGTGRGGLSVPVSFYTALRRRAEEKRPG